MYDCSTLIPSPRLQVKPKDPPCITAEDLKASGMSGIFFSVLADAKQFRDYNYRENTMHQDTDES